MNIKFLSVICTIFTSSPYIILDSKYDIAGFKDVQREITTLASVSCRIQIPTFVKMGIL